MLQGDDYLIIAFKEFFGDYMAEDKAKFLAKVEDQIKAKAKLHAEREVELLTALGREKEARLKDVRKLTEVYEQMSQIKAAQLEAEAKAKKARQDAKIARQEAQEAHRDAEAARWDAQVKAKDEWLETVCKFLIHRYPDASLDLLQHLLRVYSKYHREVIDLALNAPDLATFRQKLKPIVSDKLQPY